MIEGSRVIASPRRKLTYLQVARGLAALFVCFFHARYYLNGSKNYGDILFDRGDIGVPIFFVISGFIIAYTTQNAFTTSKIKDYFAKRYFRVAPLYFLATVVYILAEGKVSYYANEKFGEIIRVLLFLPSIETYPPLHVGWTLIYEMFFYAFFGICLFFGKRKFVVFFTATFLLVIVIPLATGSMPFSPEWYRFEPRYNYLNIVTNPMVLEFALGVLLFLVISKIKLSVKPILLINLLTSGGLILYYSFFKQAVVPDMLFAGAFIAGILLLDFSETSTYVPRFFTYLGDISYSLYLTHPIVLLIWMQACGRFNTFKNLTGLLKFIIVIVLMLVVAAFTYRFIEKSLTKLFKPLTLQKQKG